MRQPPRGVIRYEDGRVAHPSDFGSPLHRGQRIDCTTLADIERGFITANEGRARLGAPLIVDAPAVRWLCTYCAGLRVGPSCEGCGAPQHA